MHIEHDTATNTYAIVHNGQQILVDHSVQALYSKAILLLQAFSQPVTEKVTSPEEIQMALDLLTGKFEG